MAKNGKNIKAIKNEDLDIASGTDGYDPEDDEKVTISVVVGKKQAKVISNMAKGAKWSDSKVVRRLLKNIVSEN